MKKERKKQEYQGSYETIDKRDTMVFKINANGLKSFLKKGVKVNKIKQIQVYAI